MPSYTEEQLALNHHRPIIEGVLAPQRHLVPGAPREIGRTSREPRPCPALRASAPSFRDAVDVGSSSIAEDHDKNFHARNNSVTDFEASQTELPNRDSEKESITIATMTCVKYTLLRILVYWKKYISR